MAYLTGVDRHQMCLPEYIEDMVSKDNPVRVIDAFVDSLELESLGFAKAKPAHTGRPAYNPKLLLKLYIYGYFNKIRSSRKLMAECNRNIELFFLLNRLTPDFRTIADFRKDNSKAIRNVFVQFTRLCISLNLYSREILAIDGSKFRAFNGNKRMYNDEILQKKIERIEAKLNEYLSSLDCADRKDDTVEPDNYEQSSVAEKIKELSERKTLYEGYREELASTGETQKLITDPEARMMHSHKDGFHCCYNIQTAVDSKTHFIADYLVTNNRNDQGVLHDFCEQIKSTVHEPVLAIVADKGYDSKKELLNCVLDGTIPYVGFKDDKEERLIPIDYAPSEINEKERNSKDARDIKKCLQAGVLPAVYENTNVSIEVHKLGEIGAFTRGDDKSFVICPMGFQLFKRKNKKEGMEYASHAACRKCSNKCTSSKNPKHVYFGPESSCVAARMYGSLPAVNIPPPNFKPTNSFYKKNPALKTILLRIKDDIPKQKERLCISEHPFGTVKWYHGAHNILCKGIEKATAEIGLSFIAYNLRRAVNVLGTERILGVLQE